MPTRAAIVLLVVLNLGAAAWWWLHPTPPPEAAPSAPAGAARLHLIADDGADASHAAVVPASTAPAAVAAAKPSASSPTPATTATPSVGAQSLPPADAGVACEGGAGPAGGWRVYLPRLPTVDAAYATATRIADAGFSDYLVVREGADANTIALGRYGSEPAARRRVASLRAAGFPARCARILPATPA